MRAVSTHLPQFVNGVVQDFLRDYDCQSTSTGQKITNNCNNALLLCKILISIYGELKWYNPSVASFLLQSNMKIMWSVDPQSTDPWSAKYINTPSEIEYWGVQYLAICSKNTIGRILNWQFEYCMERNPCLYYKWYTFNLAILWDLPNCQVKITIK